MPMRKITTAAVAGALVVPAAGHAVGAAPAPVASVTATYDGRQINLADGWQGAQACAVLTAADVRCYDSPADMKDALGTSAKQSPVGLDSLATACGGSGLFVTLYRDTGLSGQSLSFATTSNAWTNLAAYGFDNDMESWSNTTNCAATVADGTGGGGDQLSLAAHSSSSTVGTTWKNRASSIKVQ
jgi:hypothetical protein